MADIKLTKRQREVFDFIRRHTSEKGYPPTVREIGEAVGLASPSTVHAHLANLEKLGLLRRDPSKPRAIELLDRVREDVGSAIGGAVESVRSLVGAQGLPLVGHVAAGQPILAEENIEDFFEVSPLAAGDKGDFVLEVRGDSMKNAGILDGDTVVVRKQKTANDGEIVVAIVGDDSEATVKRYFAERDHIRLEPENDDFEPIRSADVQICGRVIGVFRRVT